MNKEQLIKSTNGRIFSATFIKKDGSVRKMNARLGVKKGVTGVGRKFDPSDHHLIGAYDMQAHGHRMINLDTLTGFKCGGIEL